MSRSLARLLLLLWTLVVVAGMLTPAERLPPAALFSYDKLLHLSAFAVWGALSVRAFGLSGRQRFWIFAAGLFLAIATETAQETLPMLHRTGEIGDAVADLLGVGLGLAAAGWWQRRRTRARGEDRAR